MFDYNNIKEINLSIQNKCISINERTSICLYQYNHSKTMNIPIANINGYNKDFYIHTLPYLTNENKAFIKTFIEEWICFIKNTLKSLKSKDLRLNEDNNTYSIKLNENNNFKRYYANNNLIEIAYKDKEEIILKDYLANLNIKDILYIISEIDKLIGTETYIP